MRRRAVFLCFLEDASNLAPGRRSLSSKSTTLLLLAIGWHAVSCNNHVSSIGGADTGSGPRQWGRLLWKIPLADNTSSCVCHFSWESSGKAQRLKEEGRARMRPVSHAAARVQEPRLTIPAHTTCTRVARACWPGCRDCFATGTEPVAGSVARLETLLTPDSGPYTVASTLDYSETQLATPLRSSL